MRAGRLARHTAIFERYETVEVETQDKANDDPLYSPGGDSLGTSKQWVVKFNRGCELSQAKGLTERQQGEGTVAVGQYRIVVRGDTETNQVEPEDWRVRVDGRLFNLRSKYDPDGRRRKLVFWAEFGTGD